MQTGPGPLDSTLQGSPAAMESEIRPLRTVPSALHCKTLEWVTSQPTPHQEDTPSLSAAERLTQPCLGGTSARSPAQPNIGWDIQVHQGFQTGTGHLMCNTHWHSKGSEKSCNKAICLTQCFSCLRNPGPLFSRTAHYPTESGSTERWQTVLRRRSQPCPPPWRTEIVFGSALGPQNLVQDLEKGICGINK